MPRRLTVLIVAAALAAACDRGDAPVPRAPARPDSSTNDNAQYALMQNRIGWLTDSNIVALAAQVNDDAQGMSRMEMQAWTREPYRLLANAILRDHERLQFAIDSLASLRRIRAQVPAVAAEVKAPYDSALMAEEGVPLSEREARFIDLVVQEHERSMVDFAALAGNAVDPELKALLAGRAVLLEQTHIAQARMIAGAIAKADSAREDSLKARRGGGR